ncbi:hypothetical protein B0H16DRAFT_957553 [Mycena metata]|uniref:MYND-type domain-containing protein n=1 Tax=Mycena metata TaxID=1033252 RepID=A0AAD7K7U0_9AGAR|nr:hypothetical protein B0H16DRAFT_957553 [Mycena metata]
MASRTKYYQRVHCSVSKFKPISPEAAADFVASALGDAGPGVHLRYCAQCLYGALHIIYPKDTVEAASDFTGAKDVTDEGVEDVKPSVRMHRLQRKHFHPFWTALVRFLTVVRDSTQEIDFLFDFAACECFAARPPNPHLAEFHRIPDVLYPQLNQLHGHITGVCIHKMVSTLNDCLAMANTVKVAKNVQNSRWPTCTKDILPHGAENTVKAFLRWACFAEDMAFTTFGALGHMVKICGSLIVSDITANSEFGDVFVSTGLRVCRDAAKAVCSVHGEYHDQLVAAAEFCQRATFVGVFLESATSVAPEIYAAILPSHEEKMVQLMSLILELRTANSVAFEPVLEAQFEFFDWTIFSTLARQILVDHPDLQLPTGEFHRDIVTTQRAIEDPLLMAYKALVTAKSRTRCHAPGCPQSLASAGCEWKRCSACRVAAYCGKPCQTRAWKSGPYAHKTICPQIKALVTKGGGLDDQDAFIRNCRAADVSADEALNVAKWEFHPTLTSSAKPRLPMILGNTAGAAEFDPTAVDFNDVYWRLHPNQHPGYAERMKRVFAQFEE